MTQTDRGSTSFPLELSRELARMTWSPTFDFLYYHQNIARLYFAKKSTRGLLIYHETGMGKSLLAASIAMDAIFPRRDVATDGATRDVIILLAKSLASNMVDAIKQYIDARIRAIEARRTEGATTSEEGSDARTYDREESAAFIALAQMSQESRNSWIEHNFSFVTMNASNMMVQMSRASYAASDEDEDLVIDSKAREMMRVVPKLDGKLLIVDEAHNLFRAITNGSANAAALYRAIMGAQDLKIAFLTGTPIANDPFETVVCFNMLAGARIFPEFYNDFERLFIGQTVDDESRVMETNDATVTSGRETMKRRAKYQNRIFGLVSYVNYRSTPGVGVADILRRDSEKSAEREKQRVEFPEELPEQIVRVPMTDAQFAAYIQARKAEKRDGMEQMARGMGVSRDQQESLGARAGGTTKVFFAKRAHIHRDVPALHKPRSEFSSTYRVRSRQISNYCPPTTIRERMFERRDEEMLPVGDILDSITRLESAKYEALLARCRAHPGTLGLIYSQFVGIGGLASLARFLDQNGYEGRHATVSGFIPVEDRAAIIDAFSAPDNAHGEKTALLLVSSTGAEGIDLKGVRHVHILEPYWNYGRIRQVRARAIRNQSHVDLPPEERNVATYIYIAVAPTDLRIDAKLAPEIAEIMREKTSDEELYDNALRKQSLVEEFERAIRAVSIECAINHDAESRARECHLCAPTGDRLFSDDIESDMRVTNPCRPVVSSRVEGIKKIKVGDMMYAYREARPGTVESRMYGFDLFEEDVRLNAWRRLRANDARYDAIVAAIKSELGIDHS